MTTTISPTETSVAHLHPSTPQPLPFDRSLVARAFLLERAAGNVLIYSTGELAADAAALRAPGGVSRQYLNHWHEFLFGGLEAAGIEAPLFVHRDDAPQTAKRLRVRGTFSRRHSFEDDLEVIPIPGHTPGATAYLWDTGEHRLLFTGDTIFLRDGEWATAVLDSSDPERYVESLELIRGLDFDVLVPWAASVDGPYLASVDAAERAERIDALIAGIRS